MSRDTAHGALIYHNDILPESLVDMPGDRKLVIENLSIYPNTTLFRLAKEDHTLGNLLQKELHENPMVASASYRVAHPTQHNVEIQVHTASDGSGRRVPTPEEAFDEAITRSLTKLQRIKDCLIESAHEQGIEIGQEFLSN